jgi:hypothetical protein
MSKLVDISTQSVINTLEIESSQYLNVSSETIVQNALTEFKNAERLRKLWDKRINTILSTFDNEPMNIINNSIDKK